MTRGKVRTLAGRNLAQNCLVPSENEMHKITGYPNIGRVVAGTYMNEEPVPFGPPGFQIFHKHCKSVENEVKQYLYTY